VNELVLREHCCNFDYGREKDNGLDTLTKLITKIVLEWNPMDPVASMLKSATDYIAVNGHPTVDEFDEAISQSRPGGPFCGDALSSFFNWNPFSEAPIQEDYEKWCYVNVWKKPEAEIDQIQSDRRLGKELLKKINDKIREANKGSYSWAMCCSPSRSKNGLSFWINTGGSTNIDGWKTEADIDKFLKSDGKIVETKR
jgi:hypothetical protein